MNTNRSSNPVFNSYRTIYCTILAGILISLSCRTVPITGRKQFNLLPESELQSMAYQQYSEFLSTHQVVSATDSNTIMVKRVGNNISTAITGYFKTHNQADRVSGYSWQFNLVNDKTVNAWCMPGGKVVVYTGILPLTKDDNGLAVVLGHEIAHAIARHGNERMSQQLAIQLGGAALSVALSQKPEQTQQIFLQAYGVSTTLGALAYSRKQESEADKLGLCFMGMAGYDPNLAVPFWERMASMSQGSNPPVFLSTHPSDAQRVKDIKAFLPTALKYYNKGGNTRQPGTAPTTTPSSTPKPTSTPQTQPPASTPRPGTSRPGQTTVKPK